MTWRDLRDLAAGSRACVRWLRERDPVEVGLALFAADARAATRGTPSRYTVRVASTAERPRPVKLLLDFYALNPRPGTDGHYAYLGHSLRVPPRAATTVEIRYDWERGARLSWDDVSIRAEQVWRGAEGLPRVYAVYALVLDPAGAELDRLVIAQELRG